MRANPGSAVEVAAFDGASHDSGSGMAFELVGRDDDLASVCSFVEETGGGSGALVLEGEAGIGKSTLWLEGVTFTGESFIAPPSLSVAMVGNDVQIAWPTNNSAGYQLENAPGVMGSWAANSQTPSVSGTNYMVTITNPTGNQFFRLHRQ